MSENELIDRVAYLIGILIESTNPESRLWAELELEKLKSISIDE